MKIKNIKKTILEGMPIINCTGVVQKVSGIEILPNDFKIRKLVIPMLEKKASSIKIINSEHFLDEDDEMKFNVIRKNFPKATILCVKEKINFNEKLKTIV